MLVLTIPRRNRVTPQLISLTKRGAGQTRPQGNSGEIKGR